MTETWLNDNILDLDNYWILRTDRDIHQPINHKVEACYFIYMISGAMMVR